MPEDCVVIRTRRLDLVPMSPELMRALLAADWDEASRLLGAAIPAEWHGEDWQGLGQRPDQAEADPSVIPWLPRVLLLRGTGERAEPVVVGEAGFHGPPGEADRVNGTAVITSGQSRLPLR
jgi:[ribosomal protein S5]-alanine N-acetyltransferase